VVFELLPPPPPPAPEVPPVLPALLPPLLPPLRLEELLCPPLDPAEEDELD
jgi:hypothetical protein